MIPDTPNHELRPRDCLRRWGRRITVASMLLVTVCLGVYWLIPTPEEQLAAFDADRAVPDKDNAALIYAELLAGEEVPPDKLATAVDRINAAVLDPLFLRESRALSRELRELELPQTLSDPNGARDVGSRPWRSADCPELKQWLEKRRSRLERLQEAARKPACYFPLRSVPGRLGVFDVPLGAFRQNGFLLRWAANNDFGEGDIDAGLAKCHALAAVGRHLRGQSSRYCLLSGIAFEVMALHRLAEFVVEGPATDRQLDDIAFRYEKSENRWESARRDIDRARSIYSALLDDQRSVTLRLSLWFGQILAGYDGQAENDVHRLYLRMLSEQRGLRLLVELRRFKNRTGQWPPSLDTIASTLPPETLVDPSSDRPYVYQSSEQDFSLYSIGPNRIDENGRHKWDGPDDWPIWPPRGWGN